MTRNNDDSDGSTDLETATTTENADAADTVLAGAAAFDAGEYDIARAVWGGETPLAADADEPLRLGLAAFARATLDARHGDWAAASTAAADAVGALANADPAGVDTVTVERWLAAFRADPEVAERSPPPTVTVDGARPEPGELPLSAAAPIAAAVAVGVGDDPAIIVDGTRYARAAEAPESTRYATFIRDYAGADASRRPVVFQRLSALVERERRKEADVSGLFG